MPIIRPTYLTNLFEIVDIFVPLLEGVISPMYDVTCDVTTRYSMRDDSLKSVYFNFHPRREPLAKVMDMHVNDSGVCCTLKIVDKFTHFPTIDISGSYYGTLYDLMQDTRSYFSRIFKETNELKEKWEELLMKTFTKKDLKNGDVVTTRDGDIGVVVLGRNLIFFKSGVYMNMKDLNDDLTNRYNKHADVMVVNRDAVCFIKADPSHPFYDKCGIVYDRNKIEAVEEMTLEEVCEALGKNVKIVKR